MGSRNAPWHRNISVISITTIKIYTFTISASFTDAQLETFLSFVFSCMSQYLLRWPTSR